MYQIRIKEAKIIQKFYVCEEIIPSLDAIEVKASGWFQV